MGGKKKAVSKKRQPKVVDEDAPTIRNQYTDEDMDDDVDRFHANRDKINLDYDEGDDASDYDDPDEEGVLAVAGSSEEASDEEDSDFDVTGQDDDPNEDDRLTGQWGKKRQQFYDTDFVDPDFGDNAEDELAAEEEEAEALMLQRKQASLLSNDDFGMLSLAPKQKMAKTGKTSEAGLLKSLDFDLDAIAFGDDVAPEVVTRDFGTLSEDEKLELLMKDAPELLDLCEQFKENDDELRTFILPSQSGEQITMPAHVLALVKLRESLLLVYNLNIAYYLLLKAENATNVAAHPCIERLVQLRSLVDQLAFSKDSLVSEFSLLAAAAAKKTKGHDRNLKKIVEPLPVEKHVDRIRKRKNVQSALPDDYFPSSVQGSDAHTMTYEEEPLNTAPKSKSKIKAKLKKSAGLLNDFSDALETSATPFAKLAKKDNSSVQTVLNMLQENKVRPKKKSRAPAEGFDDTTNELNDQEEADGAAYYAASEALAKKKKLDRQALAMEVELPEDDGRDLQADGNRAISYKMLKNKGLTPSRKKEVRNPRIRNKNKFIKAEKRRKSQVQPVRSQEKAYGGESTGIRTTLTKSVRIS